MSRAEVNRAASCYHALVAILMLLGGGALLGLGIFLQVTNHGGPLDLEYASNGFLDFVLRAGILAIVLGSFILVTAVCALVALGRKCVGRTFRVIYIMLAVVVLACLIFVTVTAWLVYARRGTPLVKDFFADAWERTVRVRPEAVCEVERTFKCRSFADVTCGTETCADCTTFRNLRKALKETVRVKSERRSCYNAIKRDLRQIYLPSGIVGTILSLVVLIDIFVVCAL